jgi:hypothetical protein
MDSPLLLGLQRCIEVCEHCLQQYMRAQLSASRGFVGSLIAATAAIQAVIDADRADSEILAAVKETAANVCRDAATTIRSSGLDEDLLRCAEACERAAFFCAGDRPPPRRNCWGRASVWPTSL